MSSDMEGKMQDRYDALPSLEVEATAFRRGAEAMRELAAVYTSAQYGKNWADGYTAAVGAMQQPRVYLHIADAIRALPLPKDNTP